MTDLFLTSNNEAAIIAANQKILENCESYGMMQWDIVAKAVNQDLWFIHKPSINGRQYLERSYTQEQMMSGIDMTDIVEEEYNPNWFPPEEEF